MNVGTKSYGQKASAKRQAWNKGLEVGKRDGFTPDQVKRIGLPFLPGDSYSREKAGCDLVTAGKAAGKKSGKCRKGRKISVPFATRCAPKRQDCGAGLCQLKGYQQ
jgi:hypothetical protein